MDKSLSQDEKVQRGVDDSGQYFRYMTEFVGFTPTDAEAVRASGLVIEKYLPTIVADFYDHLLRYPPTREHFLKPDGSIDQEYLQKRMHHLTNFWRRTAYGPYDDEYARYISYVGKAHTARGADPGIYIAERYVIGQVGFIQHAISKALEKELQGIDDELLSRAVRSWNLLMMVILEMLSRAYGHEHESGSADLELQVDRAAIQQLAVDTYERGLGLVRPVKTVEVRVAREEEIPEGERKIIQAEGLSIGVFHHKGKWVALLNHCLHRGGPVATGCLEDDVLTCPWHGFQYNVLSGQLLVDPDAKLDSYPVTLRDGEVYITVPIKSTSEEAAPTVASEAAPELPVKPQLQENEFSVEELAPGKIRLVTVGDEAVAVYNVGGELFATHNRCTHAGGPLNEGSLHQTTIICPWHGSCFDVRTGSVECGPARQPVQSYQVTVTDGVARVEAKA